MTYANTPGRIGKTLSLLLRAERMIAARRVSALGKQTALVVVALLCASVAVVMLNAAAYLWLATVLTPALAALAVGGGNLVLAGLCLLMAGRLGRRADHSELREARDLAQAQLEQEIDSLIEELRSTTRDVRDLARDPLGTILPGVLTPLINALLERALAAATSAAPAEPEQGATPAEPDPTPVEESTAPTS